MNRLKFTYKDASEKKKVRDFLISKFKFKRVIGLAGPDINEYIDNFKERGCDEFEIFEVDPATLVKQLTTLKARAKISLLYKDILTADPSMRYTLFDLDFCRSVRSTKEHIRKFRDNFIMTFSLRVGLQETIDEFFKQREECIVSQEDVKVPINHTIFRTENSEYLFVRYRDTSAMCCFAKIN